MKEQPTFELINGIGYKFPVSFMVVNYDFLVQHIKKAQQLSVELEKELEIIRNYQPSLRMTERQ
ncbi:hypothetical protein [Loigolactobacillus bifermentans]|uniref:hypothetical protein n=1 Tax=Loigolactobacillus bifermentans TaxID=1607 RepID=UPI0007091B79|nr:hypothetical protein [Loigolactobacillus bifermentans]QGG59103.1 hypothetical protein LB003_00745 [Loigolactobacillus bifermentans]